MSRSELLARLAALKPWLASEGVTRLRLVGSHARDQATPDSDVDLIADFDRPLGLRQFTLQDEVSARLGVTVELGTEAALAPDIRYPLHGPARRGRCVRRSACSSAPSLACPRDKGRDYWKRWRRNAHAGT